MTTPLEPDDVDLQLRITPAPPPLPGHLKPLTQAGVKPRCRRARTPYLRVGAAVLIAVAGFTVARFTLLSPSPPGTATSFHLTGPGRARAQITLEPAHQQTATVVVRAAGLDQPPPGSYYELWFAAPGDRMPAIVFLPTPSGTATLHTTIPATIIWTQCWISLRGAIDRTLLTMHPHAA